MALNVLNITGEIIFIVSSIIVLALFSLIFLPMRKRKRLPEFKPEYPEADQAEDESTVKKRAAKESGEKVNPDGYIEDSAGDIDLGRGKVPTMTAIVLIGLLIWWLVYMLLNWSQYLLDVRLFWR